MISQWISSVPSYMLTVSRFERPRETEASPIDGSVAQATKSLLCYKARLAHRYTSATAVATIGSLVGDPERPRQWKHERFSLRDTTNGISRLTRTSRSLNSVYPGAKVEETQELPKKNPPEIGGLSRAGDRGRTGDLMLGKHTL